MSTAQLSIIGHLLAFADAKASSNPRLRFFDWETCYQNIRVKNLQSKTYTLDPAETRNIFNGTRTLTVDDTTTFALTLNPVLTGVYRLSVTAGTAAGFRTDRALTLGGNQITASVNNNVTQQFSLESSAEVNFSAVNVGDTVFIPGASTGDASGPFNPLNEGFWTVLAVVPVDSVPNLGIVCQRLPGQNFQGVSEVVALTDDPQLQAFSSGPVQSGDTLSISEGFSAVTQQTYKVQSVTQNWIEFLSASPIPLESGIQPSASGLTIYTNAQNFIRVETDQLSYVKINGGSNVPLRCRQVGEINGVGFIELWGEIWQLDVVNRNPGMQMKVYVATAEEDNS